MDGAQRRSRSGFWYLEKYFTFSTHLPVRSSCGTRSTKIKTHQAKADGLGNCPRINNQSEKTGSDRSGQIRLCTFWPGCDGKILKCKIIFVINGISFS